MFYVVNLDVRQSRRANDSASIVKRVKESFRNSESRRKRSKKPNRNAAIIEKSLRVQTNLRLHNTGRWVLI